MPTLTWSYDVLAHAEKREPIYTARARPATRIRVGNGECGVFPQRNSALLSIRMVAGLAEVIEAKDFFAAGGGFEPPDL